VVAYRLRSLLGSAYDERALTPDEILELVCTKIIDAVILATTEKGQ
jgi:hypothetical protein